MQEPDAVRDGAFEPRLRAGRRGGRVIDDHRTRREVRADAFHHRIDDRVVGQRDVNLLDAGDRLFGRRRDLRAERLEGARFRVSAVPDGDASPAPQHGFDHAAAEKSGSEKCYVVHRRLAHGCFGNRLPTQKS